MKEPQARKSILHLLFLLAAIGGCAASTLSMGGSGWGGVEITGSLVDRTGAAIEGAYVYAYLAENGDLLGPAEAMSEPSDGKGRYFLIVPEGSYTVVARKRLSGSISGPMRDGDLYGKYTGDLKAQSGPIHGLDLVLGVFRQGAEGDPKRILTTATRVAGIVVDKRGHPVEGVHVFAYRGDFRQEPPDFLAPATGPDGRFEISLPEGGTFTIGARMELRGKPRAGDLMGFWGGEQMPVPVTGGVVTEGVRIELRPHGGQPRTGEDL